MPDYKIHKDEDRYSFWHGIMADYFEGHRDVDRRSEELPYHLEKVLDNSRLLRAIIDWEIFQKLQHDAHGLELVRYCSVVGGYRVVGVALQEQLRVWEEHIAEGEMVTRKLSIASFLYQCGEYQSAINLLKESSSQVRLCGTPHQHATSTFMLGDAMCKKLQGAGGRNDIVDTMQWLNDVWDYFEASVILFQGLPQTDKVRVDTAAALNELSYVAHMFSHEMGFPDSGIQQKMKRGMEAGEESISVLTELNHQSLAKALVNFGQIYRMKYLYNNDPNSADSDVALRTWEKAAALFESTGASDYDIYYSYALYNIYMVHHDRYNDQEGLLWLKKAQAAMVNIQGADHPTSKRVEAEIAEMSY